MPDAEATHKAEASSPPPHPSKIAEGHNAKSKTKITAKSSSNSTKPSANDARSLSTTTHPAESPASASAHPSAAGRERKQVQAFKPAEAKEQTKFSVKPGKGTKLRDIPNVHHSLDRVTGKDDIMELLHNVLFKRKGMDHERKRNVLDFSGFTWDADQKESEYNKVVARLDKAPLATLHRLLDIFQLPRGGKEDGQKSAKVSRLANWLEAPRDNPDKKDLATKAAKKKVASAKKPSSATKRKRAPETDDSPSKRRKAAATKTPDAKGSSKKARKAGANRDEAKADAEDDLPLEVVAKLPSDKALRAKVEEILAGVDVRDFSLRLLMQQLEKHYGADMTSKKPLIKVTAIKYCMNHGAAAAVSDAEEDLGSEDGRKEEQADEKDTNPEQDKEEAGDNAEDNGRDDAEAGTPIYGYVMAHET